MTHSSPIALPPIECLAAALEAARTGSFSAAATALGVTHAAISRRVAGAESWAGFRLFERHGRGVRPTAEGQRLLTRLAQAFGEIELLADRYRRPAGRDVVRISVTPSFSRCWLLPRLPLIEREGIRLEIIAEQRNAELRRNEADLAVRFGRGGWNAGRETALFDERLVPAAAAGWLGAGRGVGAREIVERPLLHVGDGALWRGWCREQGSAMPRKRTDRILSSYDEAIEAAVLGYGVALWNSALHALPAGLEAAPALASTPPLRHYLIEPPADLSPAAAAAARCIRAAASTKLSTESGLPLPSRR